MSKDVLRVRGSKWHYSISKEFVCDRSLSRHARFLFIVLRSYASPISPAPFPSVSTLCALLHVNKDTLAKYMRELVARGHVQKDQRKLEQHRFGSNTYYLDEHLEGGAEKANDLPSPGFSVTEKSEPEKSEPEKPVTKKKPINKSTQKERLTTSSNGPGVAGRVEGEVDFSASQEGAKPPQTPTEVARAFVGWWRTTYQKVFGSADTTQLKRSDTKSLEALISGGIGLRILQAVSVAAWSYYMDKEKQQENAYFNCIHFSGNLKSFIQYFHVMMTKDLSLQKLDLDFTTRVNDMLVKWLPALLAKSAERVRASEQALAVVTV